MKTRKFLSACAVIVAALAVYGLAVFAGCDIWSMPETLPSPSTYTIVQLVHDRRNV
ncbi:MAG: hypothetical protein LBR23_09180 [Spirochaetaceae bacterium]|jgi:hypothetical protein|nr:hypothetical protein [Spirochaetaceae bacterium]